MTTCPRWVSTSPRLTASWRGSFFAVAKKASSPMTWCERCLPEAARGSSLRATEAESRMCQTFGKAGLMFHTHTHACTTERIIIQKIFKCKELSMREVVWPHLPMIQQQHDERKWTTGNDYQFPIYKLRFVLTSLCPIWIHLRPVRKSATFTGLPIWMPLDQTEIWQQGHQRIRNETYVLI